MFNNNRLRLARKRRRMSGVDLAKKAGLTAVTVSRLERTHSDPAEETVTALARALDYPCQFFFGPDVDEVETDAASFRSLKSMTARERDAALGVASIAYILSDFVEAEYKLPRVDLLDLSSESDPLVEARRLWCRPGTPGEPVASSDTRTPPFRRIPAQSRRAQRIR
jgi:transcriptional regulator with XRE-family HTH domain